MTDICNAGYTDGGGDGDDEEPTHPGKRPDDPGKGKGPKTR